MPVLAWPVSEGPVTLASGSSVPAAVHVWSWNLEAAVKVDQVGETVTPLAAHLSAEERARADRFVAPIHRARFIAAHSGLRQILSIYLKLDPAEIAFATGESGKPRLTSHPDVHFNLSHAQDLALLAVSMVEVGVDAELIHPVNDQIAERFFAPSEVAALAAIPEPERLAAFYACWTRKEAFLKGLGTGISAGLDSFAVTLPSQGSPKLSDSGSGITAGWVLSHLEPAEGYIGALAVRAEASTVRCFSFSL